MNTVTKRTLLVQFKFFISGPLPLCLFEALVWDLHTDGYSAFLDLVVRIVDIIEFSLRELVQVFVKGIDEVNHRAFTQTI
jgi:hypothetical protein